MLSKRVHSALVSAGVSPLLRDVAKMRAVEFLSISGIGKASLKGVVEQLERLGVQSILGASARYMDDAGKAMEGLQEDGILDRHGRLCGEAGSVADKMVTSALYGRPDEWVIRVGKDSLAVPILRASAIANAQDDLNRLLQEAGVERG